MAVFFREDHILYKRFGAYHSPVRDYASKLVLIGSAQRVGIFEALSIEHGDDYVGGSLPHFLDIMGAWLKLPEIVKGAKPDRAGGDVAAFMNEFAGESFDIVFMGNICHIYSENDNRKLLANTEDGNTYTEEQYREWLTDAGFQKIEIIDLAQKSNQLITAFLG